MKIEPRQHAGEVFLCAQDLVHVKSCTSVSIEYGDFACGRRKFKDRYNRMMTLPRFLMLNLLSESIQERPKVSRRLGGARPRCPSGDVSHLRETIRTASRIRQRPNPTGKR